MSTLTTTAGAIGALIVLSSGSLAAAEEFKIVQVIPGTAYVGKLAEPRTWSAFPYSADTGRVVSMADIGDPVLLMIEKRVAFVEARQKALADTAGQAEPQLPEGEAEPVVEVAVEEVEPVVVVGIRPPGYRADVPWRYHSRSQRYSGTRAPRYYHIEAPRYYRTPSRRAYTPRSERPWGYQAEREVYGYTIRQLRQLEQQLTGQLEQLERPNP